MSLDTIKGRGSYIFHGSAFGFGAQITHPGCQTIPTQAVAIVPPTGGESYACVKNFDYNCIITFDEATAYAAGTIDPDGTRNTLATSTIRNLNILNMIHVDLLVTRIVTRHPPREDDADPRDMAEAEVTLRGSQVQNLWVDGHDHRPEFNHDLFDECKTFGALLGRSNEKRCFSRGKGQPPSLIHTSLTGDVAPIEIPEFGRLFVGEVIAQFGYRRVNMLRFELGCSVGGSGTGGGAEGNGTDIPPAAG